MIYPLFTFVVLTILFIYLQATLRFLAVRNRKVSIKYFRGYHEGGKDIPEFIHIGGRHLTNLFETPLLFVTVAILSLSLQIETTLMVTLAWCFVGARIAHGVIHLTYNNVIHRMLAWQVSILLILFLWIGLFLEYSV